MAGRLGAVHAYHAQLLGYGFTPEAALQLTLAYQSALLVIAQN